MIPKDWMARISLANGIVMVANKEVIVTENLEMLLELDLRYFAQAFVTCDAG